MRTALGASLAALLLCLAVSASAEPTQTLSGAGSSAAAPVYRAWSTYAEKQWGTLLKYDSIGSSAGIKKIAAHEVDFGASDVAPPEADLTRQDLVLVPTFVTGAVPVVNLPRLGAPLHLDGTTLAAIFMRRIQKWNDPALRALNPGVALPDLAIIPVVRSDGSGTTYYFTDYLNHVSPEWQSTYGASTSIKWPEGVLPAKGSDGVAAAVKANAGAIGYIDFNYIADKGLVPARVRNAAGVFVDAGPDGFSSALRHSEWFEKGDFHATLANRPGPDAWPITMGTFVLVPRVAENRAGAELALSFFVRFLVHGDTLVNSMNFVRLPDKIQALAYRNLSTVVDRDGQPLGLNVLSEAMAPQ